MNGNRAAVGIAHRAVQAAHALQRVGRALESFAGAVSDALLSPDEKRALTARVYDGLAVPHTALFDWEEAWFERDLPKPPARVLIGGCGRGREVRLLLARGYEVWAFDPSLDSARQCHAESPGLRFIGCFGYEQLVRSLEAGTRRRLLPNDIRFDAALLGWGSLSHVIDERDQKALFRALAGLVPVGPLLASFYYARKIGVSQPRAARIGAAAGRLLRGRHASAAAGRVRLRALTGFTYTFDDAALRALAAEAGRVVRVMHERSFPHATFTRAIGGAAP